MFKGGKHILRDLMQKVILKVWKRPERYIKKFFQREGDCFPPNFVFFGRNGIYDSKYCNCLHCSFFKNQTLT